MFLTHFCPFGVIKLRVYLAQHGEAKSEEEDPARPLTERLEELREDIMLVGHLPHLSRLVSLLTLKSPEHEIIKFSMGGIVCLERIKPRKWMILWTVIPDMIPDQLVSE